MNDAIIFAHYHYLNSPSRTTLVRIASMHCRDGAACANLYYGVKEWPPSEYHVSLHLGLCIRE